MVITIDAIYDGKVFLPVKPVTLKPNTYVRIAVLTETAPEEAETKSFLDTAQSLDLDGPPDWSARLDEYLYGETAN